LVTHDVEEAIALADRVLVMEAGKLIFETPVDLERPRVHSGRVFVDLKERVLAQVMHGLHASQILRDLGPIPA